MFTSSEKTTFNLLDNLVEYQGSSSIFQNSKEGHLMVRGCKGSVKGLWNDFFLFRPLAGAYNFPVCRKELKIIK
jgi:hypothetical protein